MKLNTTYANNNYPIIVEHGVINLLNEINQSYDQSFLSSMILYINYLKPVRPIDSSQSCY